MLDQASLGKRIQERRKKQGLTQEQLGNELGVSAQAVSKWENGESAPDIGLLPALVRVLGTSADSLLGIDGGIGIETLSEELASRLGQQKGEAQEAALLQVLRRILFAGQEGHGVPGPAGDMSTWYSWEKDRLVGLRLWTQHGFACTAMRGLLDSQGPSPESLQMLRTLIDPGRWEVASALLKGPKNEAALLAAQTAESAAAVRKALQDLVETGLIVQDRQGYRLQAPDGLLHAALLAVLAVTHSHAKRETSEFHFYNAPATRA